MAGVEELLQATAPGASTALKAVQAVFKRRAEQRAAELFTAIGVATGANDPDDAAERLAQDLEKPWCQEAIEAGFRELMNATDPAVRACLAILVAEYVVMRRPPDLKFRRVGAVLRETAGSALETLLGISTAYVQAIAGSSPGLRVLIRSSLESNAGPTFWFGASVAPLDQVKGSMRMSDPAPVNECFEDCVRALLNGGIGRLWTGLSSSQFKGNPVAAFESGDDAPMQLLQVCLRTAHQRSWLAEGARSEE